MGGRTATLIRRAKRATKAADAVLAARVPAVDFAAVPRPAFGRAAQHLPAPKRTKADRRYMLAAKTAAELAAGLIPEPGEAVHTWIQGDFDLCQALVAVADRLPDLSHLRICTLAFSRRNAAELVGLLENRPGLSLTLLVSSFFRSHNAETFDATAADLAGFGPRAKLAAARSHAKVTCFEPAGLVVESSANLRRNGCREVATAIRDSELCRWHGRTIDALVNDAATKEANPPG